jgi:membrane-associated protein
LPALDSLTELVSSSPWTYALIFAIAALDAVLPLVPSESMLITAGVVAAVSDLSLALVIAAGASGAFAGDNGAYALGRAADARVRRLVFVRRRGARRLVWIERAFTNRAGSLIVGARFVPGGRTAVMLTAGATSLPFGRFVKFVVIAAAAWSSYAALLGYAGGRAFEGEPLTALLLGLGVAASSSAIVEALRRWGGRLLTPALKQRG